MTYFAQAETVEKAPANLNLNDEVLAYGHQMTNGRKRVCLKSRDVSVASHVLRLIPLRAGHNRAPSEMLSATPVSTGFYRFTPISTCFFKKIMKQGARIQEPSAFAQAMEDGPEKFQTSSSNGRRDSNEFQSFPMLSNRFQSLWEKIMKKEAGMAWVARGVRRGRGGEARRYWRTATIALAAREIPQLTKKFPGKSG